MHKSKVRKTIEWRLAASCMNHKLGESENGETTKTNGKTIGFCGSLGPAGLPLSLLVRQLAC